MNEFFIGNEKEELDRFIIGRISPRIYVFKTGMVPDSLKVGDTYRPISERMEEWSRIYTGMHDKQDYSAQVGDKFFRDYSVHRYLKEILNKYNLQEEDFHGVYFSREFFRDTESEDVKTAVDVISEDIASDGNHYPSYALNSIRNNAEEEEHISGPFNPRDIQKDVIDKYVEVTENGTLKKELLLYAVMRFGKTFTAMCCAQKTQAKVVVVMSGKTDVRKEWHDAVSYTANFKDEYEFIDAKAIRKCAHEAIESVLSAGKKVVIFLSLQDSSNKNAIKKYSSLFTEHVDMLIIDETHFGARAESFGKAINVSEDNDDETLPIAKARESADHFTDVTVKLHLSGTPYRILAKDEFSEENIIGFYQYTDILDKQKAWSEENLKKAEPEEEWKNPYFGFPQMLRFAFHPNKISRKRIQALSERGESCSFATMFKPKSVEKAADESHREFVYGEEVLDLLQIIDGSKQERGLLSFLNYPKIVEGKMCRHIVCVLPWKASCDALEKLIRDHSDVLPRLKEYKIINISGHDSDSVYPSVESVVSKIKEYEENDQKTITFTVGRMLTGSTVPYWDTMLYLKDTSTPEGYDQAIFRLQSPYVTEYVAEDGSTIKYDMKPQTLLIDFDPNRMFRLQAYKSEIYNVNIDERGGNEWIKRIAKELKLSPIVCFNIDKIQEVTAVNIVDVIRQYSSEKGIAETANSIDIDTDLLKDAEFLDIIKDLSAINSKKGLGDTPLTPEDGGDDINIPEDNNNHPDADDDTTTEPGDDSADDNKDKKQQKAEQKEREEKMRCYVAKILFFAFLYSEPLQSLSDIILKIRTTDEGKRIARHIGLKADDLELLLTRSNGFKINALDVQIMNQNQLSKDESKTPVERAKTAINRFGKISDAEVVTPTIIANEMVSLLPEDCLTNTISTGGKILDIASKMGEFAVALVDKANNEGLDIESVKDSIYAIPTSGIAYEFTRYVYLALGLDISCIARFTSFDLIKHEPNEEIDYERIKAVLTQNKPFGKIKLDDVAEGDDKVRFEVVVGNPPYQRSMEATSDDSLFNLFMDIGYLLSPKCCFISPAKFLFNAGKTPKPWNNKMLNDDHLKVMKYEPDGEKVFPGTEIKGGVAVTYRDEDISFGAIKVYLSNPILGNILKRVLQRCDTFIDSIVYAPESYKFSAEMHNDYPEVVERLSSGHDNDLTSNVFEKLNSLLFFNDCPKDNYEYIQILGRKNSNRCFMWIKKKYIRSHPNLMFFKVAFPKVNGNGIFGEVLTSAEIIGPNTGHTQTFLSMGAFNSETEAQNLSKYLSTKFARALLGILKVTHDNKKAVWKYVPLQDFSNSSDIDWSKSITEIDAQLYEKYGLTPDEIAFIESTIKPME